MKKYGTILVVLAFLASSLNAQTVWRADKSHSEVGFAVKHLVITTVKGVFEDYNLEIKQQKSGEDFTDAVVEMTIKTESVNTRNEGRDRHLRSKDFFLAETYPELKFTSKSVKKVSGNMYKIFGDLTMRGVTKSVELDGEYGGMVPTRRGNKAGFHITGQLNRMDWGVSFGRTMETGSLVVAKEVKIDINLELTDAPPRNDR